LVEAALELLLIRHGIAADRGAWSGRDEDRPLTPDGIRRFRQAALGLARVGQPPDAVFTSPVRRARETAEIAASAWGLGQPTDAPALAWGDLGEIDELLATQSRSGVYALVGHEPHLSELLAHLVGSKRAERLAFKKGGAARLALPGRPTDGGRLLWLLPPRVLRALAETK
jgi:phosphohistidine phosphatase